MRSLFGSTAGGGVEFADSAGEAAAGCDAVGFGDEFGFGEAEASGAFRFDAELLVAVSSALFGSVARAGDAVWEVVPGVGFAPL